MSLSNFFDVEEETLDDVKTSFLDHMDSLKTMDVREQTLYKKHQELQRYYKNWHNRSGVAKSKIWRPADITDVNRTIEEIRNLNPRLRFIQKSDRAGIDLWTTVRVFSSSFEFDQNPGRFLRFFLEAEDGRILGITSLGSDVMNLGARDRWVGWTDEQKESGMLNHTAIGTTIVPMQPFGYNFLGGKLLASFLATQYVRDVWEREYDNVLVAITTTSLYGNGSMYNGIKWWKSMGESSGKVSLKPDDIMYEKMQTLVKKTRPDEYKALLKNENGGPGTGVKQKIMNLIYKEVGITTTKYQHGFQRGVYFCPLYENTREFLREEITKDQLVLKDNLKNDTKDVLDWWLPKAESRFRKLTEENKVNPDILFYNDGMFLNWDEFKTKYLEQVGR